MLVIVAESVEPLWGQVLDKLAHYQVSQLAATLK